MKNYHFKFALSRQKGAATLLTSVILLIAITLVTFLTAKTVLQETKMTANNYRAAQAIAHADAAMDFAVTYFNENGIDSDSDGSVDTQGDEFTAPALSTITFDNNDGTCTTYDDMKSALITATGTSDDEIGVRTITQCVGSINIFSDEGPQQPLISKGSVSLTGNFKVVNRVNNTTIWTGANIDIGNSVSASTYVWPHTSMRPDITNANRSTFENTATPIQNAEIVSTKDMGLGVDIIESDATLAGLDSDEMFEAFFPVSYTHLTLPTTPYV